MLSEFYNSFYFQTTNGDLHRLVENVVQIWKPTVTYQRIGRHAVTLEPVGVGKLMIIASVTTASISVVSFNINSLTEISYSFYFGHHAIKFTQILF